MVSKYTKSEIFNQGTQKLTGGASIAHLDKNSKFIIKEALDTKANQKGAYISRQKKGYDIIDKIRESGQDYGVNLPDFISSVKSFDTDTDDTSYQSVTETKMPGIMLDTQQYNKLDDKTKNELALQLAKFMSVMHHTDILRPVTKQERKKFLLFMFPKSTWGINNDVDENVIQNKFNKFIEQFRNKNLKKILRYAATVFSQDVGQDEFIVTTHRDLRWPNVLYNEKDRKLSVIDFECANLSHIYSDFISRPVSFTWDFIQRIIIQYNKIQKHETKPFYINAETIKKILICNITNQTVEYIVNSEVNNNTVKKTDTQTYRQILIQKLERLLIQNLTKYKLFEITPDILVFDYKRRI